MSLLNCKAELKRKWKKYCVLAAAGYVNTDANPDNIFSCQRNKAICSCCHFFTKRQPKTIKPS